MPVTIKYIAQSCMDSFYQNYAPSSGFWTLNDFIFRAAATITDYYQKWYEAKYQELRQEKHKDELVGFDATMLMEQELEIKDGRADLKFPVMAFVYDQSAVGFQEIIPVQPTEVNLERSSVSEIWQYQYLPFSNRVLWYPLNGRIIFKDLGKCNVKKVLLLYVPSIMTKHGEIIEDALVPDGIIDLAINGTVAKLKELSQNTVVKKVSDGNENLVKENEMNITKP